MPTWLRRTLITFAVLLVLAGAAYYWLIVESHAPGDASYALDIDRVRAALETVPGDKPSAIEVEQVGVFTFPATAVVAGDGWGNSSLPVYSYRLVYPDGSIVVDTALNEGIGGSQLTSFDADSVRPHAGRDDRGQADRDHSRAHGPHRRAAAHGDLKTVLPKARLTPEQLAEPERSLPAKFPAGALDDYQPLVYDQYQAIAPGVVLIKAAGHTPGSQMVYVQTAGGTEVLLIGDVAWHFRNIELQRERARLVTMFLIKEDRAAVFGQLAALKRLHETQPAVHIVPGHDGQVIDALVTAGVLKRGFSP